MSLALQGKQVVYQLLASLVAYIPTHRRSGLRHSCNSSARGCVRRPVTAGMDGVFRLTNGHPLGRAKGKERTPWRYVRSPFCASACWPAGCVQSTLEPASDAALTPRDKKLLANAPYAQATIPEPYKRHIVTYHRKEAAGTIVVDSDARYLYYVLPEGKAIRYGVTVGEDALAFSGLAARRPQGGMALLDADQRHQEAARRHPGLCGARPAQSDGRARALCLCGQQGHALSHPRHQPAGIYRPRDLVGLHPPDQRGRDRPVQPREGQLDRWSCWRRGRATRRAIRAIAFTGGRDG